MFAVPGWSLSRASLQTQTTNVQNSSKTPTKDADGETQENERNISKKRKRGRDKSKSNGVVVNSENFAELWAKHIEGKGASGNANGVKSSKKRQRIDAARHSTACEVGSAEQDTARAGEKNEPDVKTSKPKKHGKKQAEKTLSNTSLPSRTEFELNSKLHTANAGNSPKRTRTLKTPKHKKQDPDTTQQSLSTDTQSPALSSTIKPTSQLALEPTAQAPEPQNPTTNLTPLQASMRSKLTSARFRHLNQTLYTTPSSASLTLFSQNPSMFSDYHAGFRQQVSIWPSNPVDSYISTIKARGSIRPAHTPHKKSKPPKPNHEAQPLPRTDKICVIADLGCGDAHLARTLSPFTKKLKLRILSFDLFAENQTVTKADVANLPLENGAVDVAIFCLALMGTNWVEFIEEAWRVLRWKGELWVAEIKSRFGRVGKEPSTRAPHRVGSKKKNSGKAAHEGEDDDRAELAIQVDGAESAKKETDVSAFVEVLRRRGFVMQEGEDAVDLSNKMFVKLAFVKALSPIKGRYVAKDKTAETWKRKGPKSRFLDEGDGDEDEGKVLKPCVYKLR